MIDAVFSIGVNYKGVINVVNRYCNYFKIQKYRPDFNTYPPIEQQEKISDLLNRYATMGEESMRLNVYCNSQRTSTQNGITKAQAVYEFCKVLRKYDVEYFQDIPKISINDK